MVIPYFYLSMPPTHAIDAFISECFHPSWYDAKKLLQIWFAEGGGMGGMDEAAPLIEPRFSMQ